ncbi:sensor histidine kinase [Microbacterium marinilacus]|uniref:histidine kinase n=1 Tax=Microbacterium marinilacus TaxID=415209 RepID=A0ABP7BK90_9MICO|nr:histidine kinase [Microbacterium marinilacus]MBY0689785.1 hypothetical protein [Microbacterium marinilacus]
MPSRPATPATPGRGLILPVLTLAVAAGYIGADVTGVVDEVVSPDVPPLAHAGLVVLQAGALLLRVRSPFAALAAVVALDLAILATSGGQLGIGALAVAAAAYGVVRRTARRPAYAALGAAAAASAAVGVAAMIGDGTGALEIVAAAATRVVVLFAAPAVAAEYATGRERLREALRERADLLERQRAESAERELRAGRTALARELHDIAGHHLSGIIVSAQAASALTRSDPERARQTLSALQDDARTALADLRRTVGLLRDDDAPASGGSSARGTVSTVPRLAAIDALVHDARERGQRVEHVTEGPSRTLSPLAETAGYRMVQESLSNAARHAPGAPTRVVVEFLPDAVRLTVDNPHAGATGAGHVAREGYGLAGMAERAALVGARLETGPASGVGWRNQLTIPAAERPHDTAAERPHDTAAQRRGDEEPA